MNLNENTLNNLTNYYYEEIKNSNFYETLIRKYKSDETLIQNISDIVNKNQSSLFNASQSYEVTSSIFDTNNERLLFLEIEKNLNDQYRILPEVCFRKILKNDNLERDLTLYRFADFFICDKEDFTPLISIEFNEEHHRYKLYEIIRDISKNKILDNANIPHITIDGTKYGLRKSQIQNYTSIILNKINEILN